MAIYNISASGSRKIKLTKYKAAIQIAVGSCLIGLMAQIKIPLIFSPVPITGQTFAIMLIGMTLGSRKGFLVALLDGGRCGIKLTIEQYLSCDFCCIGCKDKFNPGCQKHWKLYFAYHKRKLT